MDESFLIDEVLCQLQNNPETIGLEFNQQTISNRQLRHATLTLARGFSKIGITEGMHVATLMGRTPEALVCLFALWKIGAIYIPLDPAHPHARLVQICEDVQAEFIISQQGINEKLDSIPIQQVLLNPINFSEEVSMQATNNADTQLQRSSQNSIAYILYTSGSSGQPKGVEISQYSLLSLFKGIIPLLGLTSSDRYIGLANFSFDIAFFELLAPFLTGAKLLLMDTDSHKNIETICTAIEQKEVTIVQATPSLWQLINHFQWSRNNKNIKCISTGEALPVSAAKTLLKQTNTLWNLYGPTECTIWATAKKLNKKSKLNHDHPYVSIGSPLPGYNVKVIDNKQKGELTISGKGLARGYYAQVKLTVEKFIFIDVKPAQKQRAYLSGDICSHDNNGELYFHGRVDNQVKLNGYRIELEEIEAALEAHSAIRCAVVNIRKMAKSGNAVLLAFVCYEKGLPNKTAERLNTFLALSLPSYMLPQRYFFLDDIPLTYSGKKDRKNLPDISKLTLSNNTSLPTTELEKDIAALFCEILDIQEIGIYDSFFDAGGNSMLVASLMLAVNNRFSSKISLKEVLLTPPTVHSTSRLVQSLPSA